MSGLNAEDWMANYYREAAEREAKARASLKYTAGMLALFGVETATSTFDGYGDEGTIDDPVFAPNPPAGLPDGTADAIKDAFADLLPGGWEINEGSFGSVRLDVATGEAALEIEAREEEDTDEDDDDDDDNPARLA